MIEITKSETADTRTCDFTKVSKEQLRRSSQTHIGDVRIALDLFVTMLNQAGANHDADKIDSLDHFHADFVTGFKTTGWWDNHRKITRHHLQAADGVPADVNLIDVIEMIADCVMAGMARSGSVYAVEIPGGVLKRAFDNTVELLKAQVVVKPTPTPARCGSTEHVPSCSAEAGAYFEMERKEPGKRCGTCGHNTDNPNDPACYECRGNETGYKNWTPKGGAE